MRARTVPRWLEGRVAPAAAGGLVQEHRCGRGDAPKNGFATYPLRVAIPWSSFFISELPSFYAPLFASASSPRPLWS